MPLRIALHSKKSKRCPTCRHILIKPEQKAQSVRYKIKLVASNFLPAIHALVVNAPPPAANVLKRSVSVRPSEEDSRTTLHAGKTYPFRLSFSNPMYDPISIQLSVQRSSAQKTKPSFAISLPTLAIPVYAYQEAWEYEDEDEVLADLAIPGVENAPNVGAGERDAKGRVKSIGVLSRKANITTVAGEVLIGKEGTGDVRVSFYSSIRHTCSI
jgi:dynactin-4